MGEKRDVEATFAPTVHEVARARRFVTGNVPASVRDAAELVVSELVTNVVQHAETDLTVRVSTAAGTIRVEVEDSSAVLPAAVDLGDDVEHGRGLHIVEALTSAWGVESSAGGKRVWFEIETAGP